MPCTRTQHGLTRVGLEPPTSGSGVRGINHQATALPFRQGSTRDDMSITVSGAASTHVTFLASKITMILSHHINLLVTLGKYKVK